MTLSALIRHAIDGFVWRIRRPARKPPEAIAALQPQLAKARKAHRSTRHIYEAMRQAKIEQMKGCQQ